MPDADCLTDMDEARTGLRGRFARSAFLAVTAVVIGGCYFAFATRLTWTPWPDVTGGYTFNTMLRSLLEGRVDVDPRQVGMEGYERNGLTYTYFGILPALFRLPVASQLWRDWTLLSSVLAASTAALALLYAGLRLIACAGGQPSRAVGITLAASLVLSGPSIELLGKPSVYIEVILWGYAFACLALYALLPVILRARPSRDTLLVLAVCAAATVLTRISTGIGLLACVAIVLAVALRQLPTLRQRLRLAAPALVLCACGVGICLTVNQLRWGSPLKFNDFRYYTIVKDNPARQQRIREFGSFNLARIPYALGYYIAPARFFATPAASPQSRTVARLFDPPEGPPASVPATWPLWCALCAGILLPGSAQARRPVVDLGRLSGLLAALLVAPILILSYIYLAFRYRAEFAPAMLLLAMAGCRELMSWLDGLQRPRLAWGVVAAAVLLGGLQVTNSIQSAFAHGCAPWGAWTDTPQGPRDCRTREAPR
jgi:hypothetical protein